MTHDKTYTPGKPSTKWSEPNDISRAQYAAWLSERPPLVRAVAEKFDPWTVYRLKETGQRCQFLGCHEGWINCDETRADVPPDRVTIVVYAEDPVLGAITGVNVAGLDPSELEEWIDE